jgi:hypothetical protein
MPDVVGEVVVGDDEVEAEGLGFGGGGEGADAGVDEMTRRMPAAAASARTDVLHAVALADAVGDVVGDLRGLFLGGDALDGGLEEDGGGGAVDVVVAVDEDGFGAWTARWMRATAAAMPSISSRVEWRSSRVGLRRCSAAAGVAMPREMREERAKRWRREMRRPRIGGQSI